MVIRFHRNSWQIFFIGLLVFLGVSCAEKEVQVLDFTKEVNALTTDAQKQAFLEQIFEDDQGVRDAEELLNIITSYGGDSKEHLAYSERQSNQDQINLKKIEAYLKKFGHPTNDRFRDVALRTPWAVIQHSATYEDRERNFNYLYQAYSQGDLQPSTLDLYLDRMYRMKFGKRFDFGTQYRPDDRINALIKELGLLTSNPITQ